MQRKIQCRRAQWADEAANEKPEDAAGPNVGDGEANDESPLALLAARCRKPTRFDRLDPRTAPPCRFNFMLCPPSAPITNTAAAP